MESLNNKWTKHWEKIYITLDQAIVSGSNFLIGILISKILGIDDLGVYSFVWMLLMICSSLHQSFTSQPLVNEFVRHGAEGLHSFLNKAYMVQLFAAILVAFTIFLLTAILKNVNFFEIIQKVAYVTPFLVAAYVMQDYSRRVYILQKKMTKVITIDLVVNWSQVGFLLYHINSKNLNLGQILIFFTTTYIVGVCVSSIDFLRPSYSLNVYSQVVKNNWQFGKWLIATAVVQWFAGNYFIIKSGSIIGSEVAGILKVAQSIVGVLNVFFIALEYYVPKQSALIFEELGIKKLLTYTFKVLAIGLIICTGFTFLVFLFSNEIILNLFSASYLQYKNIIVAFSAFYIIVFVGFPLRFALRASNNTKTLFYSYIISVIFSLVFAEYMIRTWEVWGVIAGLAISQILMQICYVVVLLKEYRKK